MYGLSANKSGVGESSTVLLTALGDRDSEKNFLRTSGRLLTDCTLFIAKGGGGTSFETRLGGGGGGGGGGHAFLKTFPPPLPF